jgi:hypothetical protein
MGKSKQNPRYNVISCRASDAERERIWTAVGKGNLSAFVLEAVLEKVKREQLREVSGGEDYLQK